MFIAAELKGERSRTFRSTLPDRLQELLKSFICLEKHAEACRRAFPQGAGTFIADFVQVVELEKERYEAGEKWNFKLQTKPDEPNRLHHDAESIYWWLLLAAARANPDGHGSSPDEDDLHDFLDMILRRNDDWGRAAYLFDAHYRLYELLHPALSSFERVLEDIAAYLSVPWNVYIASGVVKADHAHHALRRLLLLHIISLQPGRPNHAQNVRFDTSNPRGGPAVAVQMQAPAAKPQQSSKTVMESASPPMVGKTLRPLKRRRESDTSDSATTKPDAGERDDGPPNEDAGELSRKHKRTKIDEVVEDATELPALVVPGSVRDFIEKSRTDKKWFKAAEEY